MSKGARKVWRRHIAPAIKAGLIDPVLDQNVAAIFCAYRAEVSDLDRLIRENPGASIALDPALLRTMRRRDAAADRFLRLASELGLTPVGRLRLGHREAAKKLSAEDIRKRLRARPAPEPETTQEPTPKTTLH